jgi:hypothetical protein
MQPIVNGLEAEFRGTLAFEERNAATAAGKATLQAYGLRGHPSYAIVAPDGTLLWSFSGPLDAERLRQQLMQPGGRPP